MSWNNISSNKTEVIHFDTEGQEFDGVLTGIRKDVPTTNGPASIADFKGIDGKQYAIFLSAGLISHITEDLIGRRLRIEYTGERKNASGNRTFKSFTIDEWVDD